VKFRLWIACAGLAGVASIFLALAGLGTAASPNICPTRPPAAACIAESVSPHFLTAVSSNPVPSPSDWPQAVSTTRFTNQSGLGGATASHTKISVTFSGTPIAATAPLIYIADIRTVKPDGTAVPSTCAPSATQPIAQPPAGTTSVTVTCAVGSTAGGQTVKLVVRFGAATNLKLDGDVTYGESGNDNPNGPNGIVNDNHSNADFVFVGGTQQGSCFDLTTGQTKTVTGSTASQATTATVGQTAIAGLPCTPAAAGVLTAIKSGTGQNVPGSFTRDISFTDFLSISNNGAATVLVDFLTSLPKGFKLQELVNLADPTNPQSWVEVKKCGDATNQSPDSCISDTKNLPKGGFRYILSALGTFDDAKYSG
jgi:hypothetical protein